MKKLNQIQRKAFLILDFAQIAWNNFDIFKAEYDKKNNKLYIIGDGTASFLIYCLKKFVAIGKVQN